MRKIETAYKAHRVFIDKVFFFLYDKPLFIRLASWCMERLDRRCSSTVEQLICNQLVGGSIPLIGSYVSNDCLPHESWLTQVLQWGGSRAVKGNRL